MIYLTSFPIFNFNNILYCLFKLLKNKNKYILFIYVQLNVNTISF